MAGRERRRQRGAITWLPSGSARISVFAGIDQLSGKEMRLRETVRARASRRETEREAQKGPDAPAEPGRRAAEPRTEATVNELLDRWLDVPASGFHRG
jgi:integrase